MKETNRIEFKEQLTPELEKEVVAFLNAKGGHIYIGINDKGSVVGIQNIDKIQLKIKDRLINNIRPSIMGLFEVENKEIDGKNVIVIGLACGTTPPYYIKQKGRSEAGCFIRIGASSQPMTEEMIEQLLSKRLPVSIATLPARRQDLTFAHLKIYYEEKRKRLNNRFADNLSFYTPDRHYNQVAYLFADENRFSFRFAKWFGKNRIDLVQNEELGDRCVITVINDVISRFNVENITLARKAFPTRIEKNIVDKDALRECIINAFAHNDYSEGNTPIFEVFEDRFEITTYGDVLSWMTKKEFFSGVSRPKNPEVMRIFKDLELVENLGSGIPPIVEKYGKRIFFFSKNIFRTSLPFDFSYEDDEFTTLETTLETTPETTETTKTTSETAKTTPETAKTTSETTKTTLETTKTTLETTSETTQKTSERVLSAIRKNPNILIEELAEMLDLTIDGVNWQIRKLKNLNLLRRTGPNKGGYYEIIDN
jgi:predicted HTH transcriptional regulator